MKTDAKMPAAKMSQQALEGHANPEMSAVVGDDGSAFTVMP